MEGGIRSVYVCVCATLNRMVRKYLTEKVTLREDWTQRKGETTWISQRRVLWVESRMCKGPETEPC